MFSWKSYLHSICIYTGFDYNNVYEYARSANFVAQTCISIKQGWLQRTMLCKASLAALYCILCYGTDNKCASCAAVVVLPLHRGNVLSKYMAFPVFKARQMHAGKGRGVGVRIEQDGCFCQYLEHEKAFYHCCFIA